MSKPVWIVSSDQMFLKKMEKVRTDIAKAFADHGGCPPQKSRCSRIYEHGCTDCWAEWLSQNVEVVDNE